MPTVESGPLVSLLLRNTAVQTSVWLQLFEPFVRGDYSAEHSPNYIAVYAAAMKGRERKCAISLFQALESSLVVLLMMSPRVLSTLVLSLVEIQSQLA